jgi:hypothetical protein
MDRLDTICGPQNWQCRHVNAGNGTTCCEIAIRFDGEWIWKSDGAGQTDYEGEKGQYSDAFKRAAVKFGIGRYLYDCKTGWIDLTDRWGIPDKIRDGELQNALMKAGHIQTWGDRNMANLYRLLRNSIRAGCNTADDVRRFLEDNEGNLRQLKVGYRREIEKELQSIIDGYEAVTLEANGEAA